MTTQKKIEKIKEGGILTFINLTVENLIEEGWYFEEENPNHENFELAYCRGQFCLQAVSNTNDTYTVEGTTEGLGGFEGIIELIGKYENTFEQRWVATFGIVSLC